MNNLHVYFHVICIKQRTKADEINRPNKKSVKEYTNRKQACTNMLLVNSNGSNG